MSIFFQKHVVSVRDFCKADLEYLFEITQKLRKDQHKEKVFSYLDGYILCSLFYEISTRTRFSFEKAMISMGGNIISAPEAGKQSSAAKGETLHDAVRVIEHYADLVVLRHPEVGAAKEAADYAERAIVINGGDGNGEHPVQAFSDIYTIFEERGTIDGLNIILLGDLKYSRAHHSMAMGLSNFDVNISFVSPKGLEMPDNIREIFKGRNLNETSQIDEVLHDTDIIYMTRTQLERFNTSEERDEYLAIKDQYNITSETLNKAKPGVTIMHPGPRIGGEISVDLDTYENFAYFRQVENAVFNRMALLGLIFEKL